MRIRLKTQAKNGFFWRGIGVEKGFGGMGFEKSMGKGAEKSGEKVDLKAIGVGLAFNFFASFLENPVFSTVLKPFIYRYLSVIHNDTRQKLSQI